MRNEKKFNFKTDNINKILNVKVKGFFSEDDGKAFIQEYTNCVSRINPTDYILDMDCTELSVTAQGLVPMLTGCFEMYKKNNFKNNHFNCGGNAVLKMQLNRIGRNTELQNLKVE